MTKQTKLAQSLAQRLYAALPGGHVEMSRANPNYAAYQSAQMQDPANAKQMGEMVLKATLGGLGLGLSGTKLYHLVSDMNRPKAKYTKFHSGAKTLEDDEKLAGASLYDDVVSLPGKAIQSVSQDPHGQGTALMATLLAGTGLGAYGGHKLMNSIVNKKRKEDLAEEVTDAKKQYMRALIGRKSAAALDAAFDAFQAAAKTEKQASGASTLFTLPFNFLHNIPGYGPEVARAYTLATLGLVPLSGKMTYDWTRARSRDKAIADARKARARIAGPSPVHIDPEQMVALKRVADGD
jgi:hypothetical protein